MLMYLLLWLNLELILCQKLHLCEKITPLAQLILHLFFFQIQNRAAARSRRGECTRYMTHEHRSLKKLLHPFDVSLPEKHVCLFSVRSSPYPLLPRSYPIPFLIPFDAEHVGQVGVDEGEEHVDANPWGLKGVAVDEMSVVSRSDVETLACWSNSSTTSFFFFFLGAGVMPSAASCDLTRLHQVMTKSSACVSARRCRVHP